MWDETAQLPPSQNTLNATPPTILMPGMIVPRFQDPAADGRVTPVFSKSCGGGATPPAVAGRGGRGGGWQPVRFASELGAAEAAQLAAGSHQHVLLRAGGAAGALPSAATTTTTTVGAGAAHGSAFKAIDTTTNRRDVGGASQPIAVHTPVMGVQQPQGPHSFSLGSSPLLLPSVQSWGDMRPFALGGGGTTPPLAATPPTLHTPVFSAAVSDAGSDGGGEHHGGDGAAGGGSHPHAATDAEARKTPNFVFVPFHLAEDPVAAAAHQQHRQQQQQQRGGSDKDKDGARAPAAREGDGNSSGGAAATGSSSGRTTPVRSTPPFSGVALLPPPPTHTHAPGGLGMLSQQVACERLPADTSETCGICLEGAGSGNSSIAGAPAGSVAPAAATAAAGGAPPAAAAVVGSESILVPAQPPCTCCSTATELATATEEAKVAEPQCRADGDGDSGVAHAEDKTGKAKEVKSSVDDIPDPPAPADSHDTPHDSVNNTTTTTPPPQGTHARQRYMPPSPLVRLGACGHCYHANCLQRWLLVHAACPICRRSLRHHGLADAAAAGGGGRAAAATATTASGARADP